MRPLEIHNRTHPKILEILAAVLICISLCLAYYPIDPPEIKVTYTTYLTIALFSILLVKNEYFIRNRYALLLIFLSMMFLISTYIHQIYNPPITRYADSKFRNLSFSVLFFLNMIPAMFASRDLRGLLAWSIIVFSLFYCAMNLFYDPSARDLRYSETGLNPTLMATIVIIPAIYAISQRKDRTLDKLILYPLVAISLWFSVRTGSRGPIVALIMSYGVFLTIKYGIRGVIRYAIYAPLIIFLVILFVSFLPDEVAYRFSLNELSLESHADEGDRVTLWRIALIGLQSTWMGYGLGNYSAMTFIAAPHNVILEVMFELGVYISVIYLIIILFPIWHLKSLIREDSFVVDFFVILYILNLILSVINGEMTLPSAILYVSVGFIWGCVGWRKMATKSAASSDLRAKALR